MNSPSYMKEVDYKTEYRKRLRSKKYAQGLVKAAFDESIKDGNWDAFGLILQDIVEAWGNKKAFAGRAKVSRQHLYRLFKKGANPTLKTLSPVLSELGLKLSLDEA